MALSKEKLYDIAEDEMLDDELADKFVSFMRKRFPNESDPGYAREWARRMKMGRAYGPADRKSTEALEEVGYEESSFFGGG